MQTPHNAIDRTEAAEVQELFLEQIVVLVLAEHIVEAHAAHRGIVVQEVRDTEALETPLEVLEVALEVLDIEVLEVVALEVLGIEVLEAVALEVLALDHHRLEALAVQDLLLAVEDLVAEDLLLVAEEAEDNSQNYNRET